MRILVIEDERTLAGFIEQSLRTEGYAVTVAHDGESGEAAALSGDYALVLLDLMLPGKSGLDVLDAVRARLPEMPVIALTARAAIEQKVEGLDRGANDYVTKPFSFDELLARVRSQLRMPGQRESSSLEAADIRMDLRTRRVDRNGHAVQLTAGSSNCWHTFSAIPTRCSRASRFSTRSGGSISTRARRFSRSTSAICGASCATAGDPIRSRRFATSATGYSWTVAKRRLPGGLRSQLAFAIGIVTALGIGASFLALYSGVGTRLQSQIDADLRTQLAEWNQFLTRADVSTPADFERTAEAFLASQRYHAEALILVVQVNGAATVTNDPRLIAREQQRERNATEATGLLVAPTGMSTMSVAEAGSMRVLTQPVHSADRRVGTFRVADPLRSVQRAQSSLLRTFAFVGGAHTPACRGRGVALATLIAAPVRHMADVAAAVDAGDLSARAGPVAAAASCGCCRWRSTTCSGASSGRSSDSVTSSQMPHTNCGRH